MEVAPDSLCMTESERTVKNTFILFFKDWQFNWVPKCLFYFTQKIAYGRLKTKVSSNILHLISCLRKGNKGLVSTVYCKTGPKCVPLICEQSIWVLCSLGPKQCLRVSCHVILSWHASLVQHRRHWYRKEEEWERERERILYQMSTLWRHKFWAIWASGRSVNLHLRVWYFLLLLLCLYFHHLHQQKQQTKTERRIGNAHIFFVLSLTRSSAATALSRETKGWRK